MNILTSSERQQLLANGRLQRAAHRNGDHRVDFMPVVKLFTPYAGCCWLLTEIDPDNADRAFALRDLGRGVPDLGYVSLTAIQQLPDTMGMHVVRDRFFDTDKTISAFTQQARVAGKIIA